MGNAAESQLIADTLIINTMLSAVLWASTELLSSPTPEPRGGYAKLCHDRPQVKMVRLLLLRLQWRQHVGGQTRPTNWTFCSDQKVHFCWLSLQK